MFRSLQLHITSKRDENGVFNGSVNVGVYDDTLEVKEKTLVKDFTDEDELFAALDDFLDNWPEPKLLTSEN